MAATIADTDSGVASTFECADGVLRHTLHTPAGPRTSTVPAPSADGTDLRGSWWRSYLAGHRPEAVDPDPAPLRVVELFCGPGGLALGLRQAADELGLSIQSLAAADQDRDALAVHRRNHNDVTSYDQSVTMLADSRVRGRGDKARFRYSPEILEPSWKELEGSVDVVLAAPPCTGHSTLNYNRGKGDGANRNKGDARNDLYLTVPAIAVALGAPIVIIENVPAAQWDEQEVVASAIRLFEDAEYHVTSATISADSLGWPQSRSRFLLVARRDTPPISLTDVAADLHDEARSAMWALEGLEDDTDTSFMTTTPALSEENTDRINWLFDNGEYDLPNAERPDCHKDGTTYTAVYGRLHPDKPAPTITTGFMTPGRGRFIHPTQRRVLTSREAARLQGFPDDYDFQAGREDPPKAQLAKWIGDAVPMPLGYVAALAALAPGRPARD